VYIQINPSYDNTQRNEQRTRKKNEFISKLIEQRANKEIELEYKIRHSQETSNQISNI
jgi:hypothetical protein